MNILKMTPMGIGHKSGYKIGHKIDPKQKKVKFGQGYSKPDANKPDAQWIEKHKKVIETSCQKAKEALGHEDFSSALLHFKKALELTEIIESSRSNKTSLLLNQIGITYRANKQYDEALNYFNQAMAIDMKNRNLVPSALLFTLSNIGDQFLIQGRDTEAKSTYESALSLKRTHMKEEAQSSLSRCYHGLGLIAAENSQHKKAASFFQNAIEAIEKTTHTPSIYQADLYEKSAHSLEMSGETLEAHHARTQAEKIREKLAQ